MNTTQVTLGEGEVKQDAFSDVVERASSPHVFEQYGRKKVNLVSGAKTQRKIYRKLADQKSLVVAYEAVSRKATANSKAITNESLDGTSIKSLAALSSELHRHSFKFQPVKRSYMPKQGGVRQLGIPSPRDKVVQKSMTHELEQIYEGEVFLSCSHGFRPGKSTHTALRDVKN
jgi:retron-type reverse transcriptase